MRLIDDRLVQELINYLARRPYSEVYQLIPALDSLSPQELIPALDSLSPQEEKGDDGAN